MGLFSNLFQSKDKAKPLQPTHLVIDDSVIQGGDIARVIEPLTWSVSITDGEEKYVSDLNAFTVPQRHVFALNLYAAKVTGGHHYQFFYDPSGIVWEEVLGGLEAIGAQKNVDTFKEAMFRIGGSPSKNHKSRKKQIDLLEIDSSAFDDLDRALVANQADLREMILAYVKANANDFKFSGEVNMPQ